MFDKLFLIMSSLRDGNTYCIAAARLIIKKITISTQTRKSQKSLKH